MMLYAVSRDDFVATIRQFKGSVTSCFQSLAYVGSYLL